MGACRLTTGTPDLVAGNNDRVTKSDPSYGDYERMHGVIIVLLIFAAAFLALLVWLGWMIL